MNYYQYLKDKIAKKTSEIAVVGLGYVGLQVFIQLLKKGYRVTGIEKQKSKISSLCRGISYISDVSNEEIRECLQGGHVQIDSNYDLITKMDIVIICVPTPLKENMPDNSYIAKACEEIIKRIHPGMMVVLESTTYPGTTNELICDPLSKNGYQIGKDVFVVFAPERIDPGNRQYTLANTPRVLGGATEKCSELCAGFYKVAFDCKCHVVSNVRVAEMEKLFENTFRNVNIALVNEIAMLCHNMDINVWEVIEAAKTKPYGFMPFYPGPGIGGHCIPIDPQYLLYAASSNGCKLHLVEDAVMVNKLMPSYIVKRTKSLLRERKVKIKDARVMLLGISYKKDVNDMRESPAISILDMLEEDGVKVLYNDPFIDSFTYKQKKYKRSRLSDIEKVDLAILITDHSMYDTIEICTKAPIILDTRNMFKNIKRENIKKL